MLSIYNLTNTGATHKFCLRDDFILELYQSICYYEFGCDMIVNETEMKGRRCKQLYGAVGKTLPGDALFVKFCTADQTPKLLPSFRVQLNPVRSIKMSRKQK